MIADELDRLDPEQLRQALRYQGALAQHVPDGAGIIGLDLMQEAYQSYVAFAENLAAVDATGLILWLVVFRGCLAARSLSLWPRYLAFVACCEEIQ